MNETTGTSRMRMADLLSPQFMARLDGLDVATRRILRSRLQGERRSKSRGQGVEFADHRPYGIGDDLRFIDWNIYGRLDQLFLKLFLEEQDLTVHIALDMSRSMAYGEPSKVLFAKRLAAALGYISLVHNNRLTVQTFGEGIQGQLASMRGRSYLPSLAEMLLTAYPDGASQFDAACRQMAASRTGSGIMVVLSDFFFKEGYETGLRRLVGQHYDLYVFQVLSPQEMAPPLSGDLKLVDIEDGDLAEVTVGGALLKYYQRNLAAYCNDLKVFCARHGIVYAPTRTDDSVEALVLNTLRKMGMLR